MAREWTRIEVEATIADYFAMLQAELRGEPYNKTEHRRHLKRLLHDRSDGAIERKHQNISATLIELGYPYIDGYKPLRNYQQLLYDVVAERVAGDSGLQEIVALGVVQPANVPEIEDILSALEDPPKRRREPGRRLADRRRGYGRRPPRPRVDYLALEARNSSLGAAGESFVLRFERARLIHAGKDDLADRIEHVSDAVGDHEGFDIRSYEVNGKDRLIEVKTTAYGKETPFYLSRNELETSQERARHYQLYRVFRFRADPALFNVRGALDESCVLDPVQYIGWVA